MVHKGRVSAFLASIRPDRTRKPTPLDEAQPKPGSQEELADLQARLEARGDSNPDVAPTSTNEPIPPVPDEPAE